jgi:uncharacterized membrane protein YeaQ/YmgE (transglycosylase-associated protein family)
MIGMSFCSSLVLFVISVIVSGILFFLLKIKTGKGVVGFIAEICIGWFGAWLGWILEHWWNQVCNVYLIPAILGSASLILVVHVLYPPPKEIKPNI